MENENNQGQGNLTYEELFPKSKQDVIDVKAEKTLNTIAYIVLILGLIATGITFIALLIIPETFLLSFVIAPAIAVYVLLLWSVMKVLANISLTLKDIDRKMNAANP